MKYKVGDKIICFKNFYMASGKRTYTKGKVYRIVSTNNNQYDIPDDLEDNHTMVDDDYIKDYFISAREGKLKRILSL